MAQLILFLLALPSWSADFVLLGKVSWKPKTVIEKTQFGGISALVLRANTLVLLSDDRGYVNEPRFYEFDIRPDGKLWKFENPKLRMLTLPPSTKIREIVDPESMVALDEGFLIGSEGDNNKKPRVPPRIFRAGPTGAWQEEVVLPEKLLPESVGRQKMGVSNNFAFEALTISEKKDFIWFTTERPLVQDSEVKENLYRYRLFQMKKSAKTFKLDQELYFEGPLRPSREGVSLLHGFTDIIQIKDKVFWLLERTLRLKGKNLLYDCRLIEMDFARATQVQDDLSLLKVKSPTAAEILKVHELTFENEALGNCEGMAFGPGVDAYQKTLWVVTDNNFSKTDDTVLYFFGVKE